MVGAVPDQQHTPAEPRLTARLRAVLEQVPALVAVLHGPDHVVAFANGRRDIIPSAAPVLGRPLREVLGAVGDQPEATRFTRQLGAVLESGTAVHGWEAPIVLPGTDDPSYWDYAMIPLADPGEVPDSVVVHAVEVTRLVEQRSRAEEAEHRFTTLFESNVIGVTITDAERLLVANDAFL
jgi:PAS domain-containing protein